MGSGETAASEWQLRAAVCVHAGRRQEKQGRSRQAAHHMAVACKKVQLSRSAHKAPVLSAPPRLTSPTDASGCLSGLWLGRWKPACPVASLSLNPEAEGEDMWEAWLPPLRRCRLGGPPVLRMSSSLCTHPSSAAERR